MWCCRLTHQNLHSAITSSVQKAATKSSNRMPQPPRQPKPSNRLSAQATGPGLAASKKRNSAKAANCPQNPMGMASHSTSQKATTSSQTMAPGSATPMWRAVTVQAHQPPRVLKTMSRPICRGVANQACNTKKASQAHSVPTVPGALGERPAPKPRAMQWAGWASRKRGPGRSEGMALIGLPSCFALRCELAWEQPGARSWTLLQLDVLGIAHPVLGGKAGVGACGQVLTPGNGAGGAVPGLLG